MKTTNRTTISLGAALRADREMSGVKVETLAKAFVCSLDTAYRILEGDWDERASDFRHAIATLPISTSDAVRSAIAPPRDDADGDVNGDGRVTPEDSFDGVIAAVNELGGALNDYKAAAKHGVISCDDSARLAVKEDRIFDLIRGVRAAREASTAARGPRSVAG